MNHFFSFLLSLLSGGGRILALVRRAEWCGCEIRRSDGDVGGRVRAEVEGAVVLLIAFFPPNQTLSPAP